MAQFKVGDRVLLDYSGQFTGRMATVVAESDLGYPSVRVDGELDSFMCFEGYLRTPEPPKPSSPPVIEIFIANLTINIQQ